MTGTAHGRGSHSDVLETLGRRIATGELPEGRILTLADLELEHGASRTVIREAVRVLESRGMLASRRRVGITVLPHAEWDAFDAAVIRWNLAGPRRQEQLAMLTELRGAIDRWHRSKMGHDEFELVGLTLSFARDDERTPLVDESRKFHRERFGFVVARRRVHSPTF